MLEFLKRFSAPIAFVGLLLIAAVAMVGDTQNPDQKLPWWRELVLEVVAPVQQLVSVPATAVRNVWGRYMNLIDVGIENERLLERVAELEEISLQYQEALVASGHLQRIAAMRGDFEIPMLPAQVVGLDISLWFRTVVVDRGRNDGVNAGNPIITNNGVAGLVTAASSHVAKVMLLLDRQSAVDGVVQRSRTRGVVHGTGAGKLEFEFVAREGDILPGDIVLTSGLDAVYPKGLRIGSVSEIRDRGSDLIQVAILTPAVDFERLEQVFVMFHQGPTMELLYGTSTALTGDEEDDDPAPSDDESGNKSGTESAAAVAAGPDPPSPAS
ncbi:MAG: rod shape-determining protein MreC [Myxococcales bacterium]|nr:rod shape-determining protein MreC [Myxococcales bacterium]